VEGRHVVSRRLFWALTSPVGDLSVVRIYTRPILSLGDFYHLTAGRTDRGCFSDAIANFYHTAELGGCRPADSSVPLGDGVSPIWLPAAALIPASFTEAYQLDRYCCLFHDPCL